MDGHLLLLAEGQMFQEDRAGEGQCVHVLRASSKDLVRPKGKVECELIRPSPASWHSASDALTFPALQSSAH